MILKIIAEIVPQGRTEGTRKKKEKCVAVSVIRTYTIHNPTTEID